MMLGSTWEQFSHYVSMGLRSTEWSLGTGPLRSRSSGALGLHLLILSIACFLGLGGTG